jgi:hypothetical protein
MATVADGQRESQGQQRLLQTSWATRLLSRGEPRLRGFCSRPGRPTSPLKRPLSTFLSFCCDPNKEQKS